MVKEITLIAQQNKQIQQSYTLSNSGQQKCRYTLIAEKNAELFVHFELGSLEEEAESQIELLVQLLALEPNGQIRVTASIATGKGQEHKITTEQIHTAPDTLSSVGIKAVVREGGKHDYKSLIRLEPDSLRANAEQENKILQLGPGAKISSKPTLQILHDDVQCGHGTAISQLDKEQLFLCQSRGFNFPDSQRFLIKHFLNSGRLLII